jgi:predicted DsbA family dithiol-disulfide isomerase
MFCPAMTELSVDIWSDIACPWCYVGKRHFETALSDFPHARQVRVTWRAFELDPSAPAEREGDYVARLGHKYGVPAAQAQSMIERMTAVARSVGLEFRFDRIRSGNTFNAHRLLHLAAERDVQDAVKERFLRGYLCEGEAIGTSEALQRLATEAGLDADEVASVLASDSYGGEVRHEQAQAHELGISGVPFFVIGRYGVSGAQPPTAIRSVLDKAWGDIAAVPVFAEGAACGPDGC